MSAMGPLRLFRVERCKSLRLPSLSSNEDSQPFRCSLYSCYGMAATHGAGLSIRAFHGPVETRNTCPPYALRVFPLAWHYAQDVDTDPR